MQENSHASALVPVKYSISKELGLPINPSATFNGFERGHFAVPKIDENYVFEPAKVKDMLAFWRSGLVALKIIGDPAAGKTSLVEQWHARFGIPLRKVSCTSQTEAFRLIGRLTPMQDGTLKWVDGPVLAAAREGTSVLLDEYNTLQPEESTGLNMLLEGYSIVIEETGEIVTPKPGYKVFATENSVHSKLQVTGRHLQDAANDDRWMCMSANYLPEELEKQVLLNVLSKQYPAYHAQNPTGFEMMCSQLVEIANKVRTAYRNGESSIEKPLSTRSLIRWAILKVEYDALTSSSNPEKAKVFFYALDRAVSMPIEMADSVKEMVRATTGLG